MTDRGDNFDTPLFDEDDGVDFDASFLSEDSLGAEWLQGFVSAIDPAQSKDAALWKPLPGPQEEAFYSEADELFYGGAAGGGKGARGVTKVHTPFGYKLMVDLKRGDQICAADGTVQKVLNVYPQGKKQFYRFTFADGAVCDVTEDHIFYHWLAGKKIKADRQYILYNPDKGVHYEPVRGRLEEAKYLYEYHQQQVAMQEQGKRPYWIITPLPKPLRYTLSINPGNRVHYQNLHPYVLGILISEGSLSRNTVSFASADKEIVEKVSSLLPDNIRIGDISHDIVHSVIMEDRVLGNPVKDALVHFGLWGCKADNKFIPSVYLYLSVDEREQLMQGLIDGDGYVDDRGHMSYSTISERLAKDVQQLAWSLGCKATITEKEPTYTYKGETKNGQRAYNVWIQGDDLERLVHLQRKRERVKEYNGGASEAGRRVTNIEKIDVDDAYCISVDHPSGLFVHDDFIVTHNTDLMLGLVLSDLSPHKKSIIFRRSYPELKDIVTRAQEILSGTGARFKAGNQMRFAGLPYGKTLELGSVPSFQSAQKYRGRPHDLKLFDEVCDLPESIYTFLIGWARTTEEGVPVRVVSAGNPPSTSEGEWVIRRWGPWLDPLHPNPAHPGELRWFATLDGEDKEITEDVSPDGAQGKPFMWTSKRGPEEEIQPKSRTFIPAKLSDNPYLAKTDYRAVLQNMPEPYRSQLLYGDFGMTVKADPWQVIPTEWVIAAEKRWVEAQKSGTLAENEKTNVSFGLDVAEAGADNTVLVKLTGTYMQYFEVIKADDDDIMRQVDLIEMKLMGMKRAPIGVDAIGVGVGVASALKRKGYVVAPIKVSRATRHKDKMGIFSFLNVRAEIWWRMREAMDPHSDNPMSIPPNARLRAELTSAKYERTPNDKLKIEDKRKIKERLGRSPDIAEALMLALYVQTRGAVPLRMA